MDRHRRGGLIFRASHGLGVYQGQFLAVEWTGYDADCRPSRQHSPSHLVRTPWLLALLPVSHDWWQFIQMLPDECIRVSGENGCDHLISFFWKANEIFRFWTAPIDSDRNTSGAPSSCFLLLWPVRSSR